MDWFSVGDGYKRRKKGEAGSWKEETSGGTGEKNNADLFHPASDL